jgi:hypothetical protein
LKQRDIRTREGVGRLRAGTSCSIAQRTVKI